MDMLDIDLDWMEGDLQPTVHDTYEIQRPNYDSILCMFSSKNLKIFASGVSSEEFATFVKVYSAFEQEKINITDCIRNEVEISSFYSTLNNNGIKVRDVSHYLSKNATRDSSVVSMLAALNKTGSNVPVHICGKDFVSKFATDLFREQFKDLQMMGTRGDMTVSLKVIDQIPSKDKHPLNKFVENLKEDVPINVPKYAAAMFPAVDEVAASAQRPKSNLADPLNITYSEVPSRKAASYQKTATEWISKVLPSISMYDINEKNTGNFLNNKVFDDDITSTSCYNMFAETGAIGDVYTNSTAWKRIFPGITSDIIKFDDVVAVKSLKYKDCTINDRRVVAVANKMTEGKIFGLSPKQPLQKFVPAQLRRIMSPQEAIDCAQICLMTLDQVFGAVKSYPQLFINYVIHLIDPLSQLCILLPLALLKTDAYRDFYHAIVKDSSFDKGGAFLVSSGSASPLSNACSLIYVYLLPFIYKFYTLPEQYSDKRHEIVNQALDFFLEKYPSRKAFVVISDMIRGHILKEFTVYHGAVVNKSSQFKHFQEEKIMSENGVFDNYDDDSHMDEDYVGSDVSGNDDDGQGDFFDKSSDEDCEYGVFVEGTLKVDTRNVCDELSEKEFSENSGVVIKELGELYDLKGNREGYYAFDITDDRFVAFFGKTFNYDYEFYPGLPHKPNYFWFDKTYRKAKE